MIDRSLTVVTPEELKEHSENDSVLQTVRIYVVDGWPRRLEDEQLHGFFNIKVELSIWNDCCLARGQLAIIPSSFRRKVLAVAHDRHLGTVRMEQRCRGAIWRPGIDRDIEGLVRECEACILSGKSVHPHVAPLQPLDKIQIDIMGELHGAPQNYRYLVVFHDLCSKWPEV